MPTAQEKWKSSGISDAHAKLLRYKELTPEETQKITGTKVPSLKLPYWTSDGRPSTFFRLRFLAAPAGFALAKPRRYAQPKGTLNEVYLPPLCGKSWAVLSKEVDGNELLITEGELKAAAACAAGFYCIGLGGVDVWRAGKRGIGLLPQLEAIDWKQRQVKIVFDSDAAVNQGVVAAQCRLARELAARGARVCVASLPPADDGAKQGLDDFLLVRGKEKLDEVLACAVELDEGAALWALNEEVVYIKEQGVVLVQKNGQQIQPGGFVYHAYSNRYFYLKKTNAKGVEVSVKTPLAPRWLAWEARFELEKIVYAPGKPKFYSGQWNDWKGWPVEPKPGDLRPWKWLMGYVFKNKLKERQWFEQWLAYPIQNPGAKMFTAACIWGTAHGTGKTLVGHTMMKLYGENSSEVKPENLKGSFNGWARNKQFVLGDEITGNDQRDHADKLKGLITQRDLMINIKFLPEYAVQDCVNYLFTSNHPDAFFLEDNDRRFFIHELTGPPASRAEYMAYDAWYKCGGGQAALFHYLLHLPLGGFDPMGAALETDSKRAMILDNKSDVGAWVASLKEDPVNNLRVLGEKLALGCDVFTNRELLRAYDPEGRGRVSACGMGRELKKAGLRQCNDGRPVRLNGGLDRLYAVRDVPRWAAATHKELSEHWELYHSGKKY